MSTMDIIVQVLEGSRKVTTETAAVSHDATFMELLEMVTDGCSFIKHPQLEKGSYHCSNI